MATPPPTSGAAKPAAAVDRPPVPRTKASLLTKIYAGLSAAVLIVFLLAGVFGWEVTDGATDKAPGSARRGPGGSVYFWHVGYHGGK